MYSVAVWGLGKDYYKLREKFICAQEKKQIEFSYGIDKETKKSDNLFTYGLIFPEQINEINVDYIIIASTNYYWDIYIELIRLGIEKNRIIDARIFCENDFDFESYVNKGWICNTIHDGIIDDYTYADLERCHIGKGLRMTLGRKSYLSKTYIDYDEQRNTEVYIGSYTSIAKSVRLQVGMNLDHNYNYITNYGLTHIKGYEAKVAKEKYSLYIGNDVWIGSRAIIKGGISVGNGSVIAADSVVVKNVPEYSIVGGNPARVIKYRFPEELIKRINALQWWEKSENELEELWEYVDDISLFIERFEKKFQICEDK